MDKQPKYLGNREEFSGLDTFKSTEAWTYRAVYESDEVTALCPATGQPDYYTVRIELDDPGTDDIMHFLESKSLKLYLGSFRNEGIFAEDLAGEIARAVGEATDNDVRVTVNQKPRGGIGIEAQATWQNPEMTR